VLFQRPLPAGFFKAHGKSSRLIIHFKNRNFRSLSGELVSRRQTRKACADYSDFHFLVGNRLKIEISVCAVNSFNDICFVVDFFIGPDD